MASLQQLRARISSVKSTRKITSAMKVVAAAKLRRAQLRAAAARPYAEASSRMVSELARNLSGREGLPLLLAGTGQEKVHLVVVLSSDRGLAGGFNGNVSRRAAALVRELQEKGQTVKIMTVGLKTYANLNRLFPGQVVHQQRLSSGKEITIADSEALSTRLVRMLEGGEFDSCSLVYNRFKNTMTQIPSVRPLVPAPLDEAPAQAGAAQAVYEFEPDDDVLLRRLLPRNLQVQLFAAMLESMAGEQGARMTAMDSATRNADKAVDGLTRSYNRLRQAAVTNELIDIISGAEAV